MAGVVLSALAPFSLARPHQLQALAAADACAEDDLVGIGILPSGLVCRNRAAWPCLVKPGQRYIACFETLAQLALLQATHSHIGGGRYSFSMLSGTDNSATEASLNKLFTTSWPLQLFVQLTAFWAHAHNVLLQPTHVPGRGNDWADDLSRGRLARFSHRPESRIRFSPAGLAMSGRGIQLCPMDAPWRPEHPPALLSQPYLHPNMHCNQMAVFALAARTTGCVSQPLTSSRSDRKKCRPCSQPRAWSRGHLPCQVQPHSEGRVMRPAAQLARLYRGCLKH